MISINIHSNPYSDFKLEAKLHFEKGKIIVITGESGAGKSSLLNTIAGLIKCSGSIQIGEQICLDSSSKINLKPQDRSIAYVFQESTLFPNMTVRQNLEYALNGSITKESLDHYLEKVNIKEFYNRKPHQLSGGQKQRVDLIRSLITQPQLLLLDEPANAQDLQNRKNLQELLLKEKEDGMSIIMVSHDPSEIQYLADEVYVMEAGQLNKNASFEQKKKKPFEINGKIHAIQNGQATIETCLGELLVTSQADWQIGKEIKLKQEDINLEESK